MCTGSAWRWIRVHTSTPTAASVHSSIPTTGTAARHRLRPTSYSICKQAHTPATQDLASLSETARGGVVQTDQPPHDANGPGAWAKNTHQGREARATTSILALPEDTWLQLRARRHNPDDPPHSLQNYDQPHGPPFFPRNIPPHGGRPQDAVQEQAPIHDRRGRGDGAVERDDSAVEKRQRRQGRNDGQRRQGTWSMFLGLKCRGGARKFLRNSIAAK